MNEDGSENGYNYYSNSYANPPSGIWSPLAHHLTQQLPQQPSGTTSPPMPPSTQSHHGLPQHQSSQRPQGPAFEDSLPFSDYRFQPDPFNYYQQQPQHPHMFLADPEGSLGNNHNYSNGFQPFDYLNSPPSSSSQHHAANAYGSVLYGSSLQQSHSPHEAKPDDDCALKRKISLQAGKKLKKEAIRPPIKPVRQNSNPNIPKRKSRPQFNKSYSYSIDTNKDCKKAGDSGSQDPSYDSKSHLAKSIFDFKRKPNFYLNLDNLKNSSLNSLDQQSLSSPASGTASIAAPNSHLKIFDNDLHFDNDFNNDLTPNMKPPGTNEHDYFEDYLIPTSFDNASNNGSTPHGGNINANVPTAVDAVAPTSDNNDDLTGFNFNLYDKDYADYDSDELGKNASRFDVKINVDNDFDTNHHGHKHSNATDYDLLDHPIQFGDQDHYLGNMLYKEDEFLDVDLPKFMPLTSFDTDDDNVNYNTYKTNDDDYDNDSNNNNNNNTNNTNNNDNNTNNNRLIQDKGGYLGANNNHNSKALTELNLDKKSPLSPISNSPNSQVNLSVGSNSGISPHLYKTNSNQSISSTNSTSSANNVKDKQSKKKTPKGAVCPICGKYISRDLSRHLRIHDDIGRFRCVYPSICSHKTGKFNRPYDYKKHLLHFHFAFDDPQGKTANNLTDKLPFMGNCKACNYKCTAKEWLELHVLTNDEAQKCKFTERDPAPPESKSKIAKLKKLGYDSDNIEEDT